MQRRYSIAEEDRGINTIKYSGRVDRSLSIQDLGTTQKEINYTWGRRGRGYSPKKRSSSKGLETETALGLHRNAISSS